MQEKFNEDFVQGILKSALSDKNFFEVLRSVLKPEYLPNEHYKSLWRTMVVEFETNECKTVPKIAVLRLHFRKNIDVLSVINDINNFDLKENHSDDLLRALEEFIRQNMFVSSYNEIGDLYNRGKKDFAYQTFVKSSEEFQKFTLRAKKFDEIFSGFNHRVAEREIAKIDGSKRVRIPTGIDELDNLTNGGFETGEFVLIMGDSGVGKSFLGNHIGVNTSRRGENVYHAQAEGTREQVLGRYDSAWTGSKYFDIKQNEIDQDKQRKIQRVIDNIKGEIFVETFERFGSKTILDVRNSLIELKKNHDIKVVILDYMDLVDPGDGFNYGPTMERFRQQKVSRACKDIAVELNVVFISFTQVSSIAPELLNDPNFVITRYNLAEDKGKVRPVDYLLSINQTRDEKKKQICRLFLEKSREHAGSEVIYIYQNLARSRFYDRIRTLENITDNADFRAVVAEEKSSKRTRKSKKDDVENTGLKISVKRVIEEE